MTPAFEELQRLLKGLPGVGYRSAERIALNLLVEKPARLPELVRALEQAAKSVRRCERCGTCDAFPCLVDAKGDADGGVVVVGADREGERPAARATCDGRTR